MPQIAWNVSDCVTATCLETWGAPCTYHDVGGLDFFLLALRASHGLLDLDGPADLDADAHVEEDEANVRKDLGQQRLGQEVVVHDVELEQDVAYAGNCCVTCVQGEPKPKEP